MLLYKGGGESEKERIVTIWRRESFYFICAATLSRSKGDLISSLQLLPTSCRALCSGDRKLERVNVLSSISLNNIDF